MPDNVTIHVSSSEAIEPAWLKPLLVNSADVTIEAEDNRLNIQWSQGWKIAISTMPAGAIANHLNGFTGFAHQLGASVATIQHIEGTKQVFGVVIEPGFEHFGYTKSLVLGITQRLNGVFFAGNGVYSKDNQLLFGALNMPLRFFPEFPAETPLSINRKKRSIEILKAEGIPYIEHLPVIDDETSAKLRSKEDVVYRAMILSVLSALGMGVDKERFNRLVKKYGLKDRFSPQEMKMIRKAKPSQNEQAMFSWRIESYWTLLWALGFIEDLGKADNTCDVPKAVQLLQAHTAESFMAQAQFRPLSEILDMLDLTYRYHWTVQESQVQQQPAPAGLHPGVVYERHYALNWLTSYEDADWDEVQTPT